MTPSQAQDLKNLPADFSKMAAAADETAKALNDFRGAWIQVRNISEFFIAKKREQITSRS